MVDWFKRFCERHDLDSVELIVGTIVFGCLMAAWFMLMIALAALGGR